MLNTDINKIIQLACRAGKITLENGAEIYRVEDTIKRICNTYGIMHADSFVTPTVIILSVVDNEGKTHSLLHRITYRTVNLDKVSKINDLSRHIVSNGLAVESFEAELDKIEKLKSYSNRTVVIFSSLGAGFFTMMFGGTPKDFVISCIIGILLKILSISLNSLKLNEFFTNILGGAIAALVALISSKLGFADNIDKIIIGSIMLLVPGLAITNAIRDTIAGDLVSGVSRAIEAFFVAIAIAVGSGIIMKFWILYFGGINI